MNIVEVTKQAIADYPGIAELVGTGYAQTDRVDDTRQGYGISLTSDTLTREDVLGNQRRTASLLMYWVQGAGTDVERADNNAQLLGLAYYLERLRGQAVTATIDNTEWQGTIQRVNTANQMAYTVSQDGQWMTYQMQIRVEYTLEGDNE